MKGIIQYMKAYWRGIVLVVAVKLLAALGELAILYSGAYDRPGGAPG